jgi:hypothetical protein
MFPRLLGLYHDQMNHSSNNIPSFSAKCNAISFPIPPEAPVMSTFFKMSFSFIILSQIKNAVMTFEQQ